MDTGKRIIDGRYRLDSVVGSGGMGVVWRAFDQRLERLVAVKEVRFPASVTAEERASLTQRALTEAQSAGQLDHPNIVPVHDVIEFDGCPFIIMRLIDGASLDQLITADGPLDLFTTAAVGISMLGALSAAHAANIVHRDVKPQNVLIQRNGTALLTDFSIAAAFGTGTITGTGVLLGSPGYIAPERLMSGRTGPAGDLFALGATLYYAVEGVGPFAASEPLAGLFATATLPHPRPQRAGRLTPVIDGLLAKEPTQRLDAAQALELLEEIVEARRQSTRVARTITGPRPSPRPAASPSPGSISPAPIQRAPGPPPVPGPQPPTSLPQPRVPGPQPRVSAPQPAIAGPQRLPTSRPQGDEPSEAVTQAFVVPPSVPVGPPGWPATPPPPAHRRPRKQRTAFLAAASVVLLLLLTGGVVASLVAHAHHTTMQVDSANDVKLPNSSETSSTSASRKGAVPLPRTSKSPSASSSSPKAGPAAQVTSASLAISPSQHTGTCKNVHVKMSIRITVANAPTTVRYTVHGPGGTWRSATATIAAGSTSYTQTLSSTVSRASSGPLSAYLTVTAPNNVTSTPAVVHLSCTTTAPPPPPVGPTTPPPATTSPTPPESPSSPADPTTSSQSPVSDPTTSASTSAGVSVSADPGVS